NPMAVCPDSSKVREGFARDDLFVCVHEQFMTETAAMADVVLPATTFLEHDDVYVAGAHTVLQVARRVVEPFAECRSNHDVIVALARRLGARHPGFELTPWQLIDATFAASGYPDAATVYERGGHDCAPPFERAHFLTGFGFPDGRFRFKPDWAALGPDAGRMPALPDQIAFDAACPERPFRLVTAPARSFLNTSFTETASSRGREGRPAAKLHPDDCAALGLAAGDPVRLGNERGSVVVHAEPFDGLQRGVVVVEGVWPNAAFVEGRGINTLTSAEPGWPGGGAVFHDTAVWVERAG
ncbi:MAG TPA: molybdopterin-dependent oxidoreductase, partial [Polyangiaceae bacterium]|nr:molybdopterin-dependent oxidoreductase [Polyangiaceae bacterium]